jgi:hypothetical protein
MKAILVKRFDPDTVFFIVDENDNTAHFDNNGKRIREFVSNHPLKSVVIFYSLDIDSFEIEELDY